MPERQGEQQGTGALTLGRKDGECVVICAPDGTQIQVHVLKRRGRSLGLRIQCPRSYRIVRGELLPEPTPEQAARREPEASAA